MAQQIKKKFLSPEVINYFDDQINSVESSVSALESSKADKSYADSQDAAKLVEAKAYTDAQIAAIPAVDLSSYETIANVDSKDAAKLVEAKAYTDSKIAAIPSVDLSGYYTKSQVDSKDAAIQLDLDNLDGYAQDVRVDLDQEILDRASQDTAKLLEAKAYTDLKISEIPAVDLSGYYTKTQVDSKESGLQSQINTEKGRIDAILSASEADKDSFAEIVSLINSVDTSNDTAFAGYVFSNNARVDALEAKGFSKGSQVVGAELGFIDLDKQYATILSVSVGRLMVHEGEDFTVSVVGGVSRLTWINSLANPSGEEKIESGDKVFWSGAF